MTPETKTILIAGLGLGIAGGLFYWWKTSQDANRKVADDKQASAKSLPAGQTPQSFLVSKAPADAAKAPADAAKAPADAAKAPADAAKAPADIPQPPPAVPPREGDDLFSDASKQQPQDTPPPNVAAPPSASRMMRRPFASKPVASVPRVGQAGVDDRNIAANARTAFDIISKLIEISYQSEFSLLPRNSPLQPKQLSAYAGFTDELKAAIAHYQIAHNMAGTGIPDQATMDNLNDYMATIISKSSGKYPQSFRVVV